MKNGKSFGDFPQYSMSENKPQICEGQRTIIRINAKEKASNNRHYHTTYSQNHRKFKNKENLKEIWGKNILLLARTKR